MKRDRTADRNPAIHNPGLTAESVIALRWACGVFIDTVENSDMSRDRKIKFLGVGVRAFLAAEAELLGRPLA